MPPHRENSGRQQLRKEEAEVRGLRYQQTLLTEITARLRAILARTVVIGSTMTLLLRQKNELMHTIESTPWSNDNADEKERLTARLDSVVDTLLLLFDEKNALREEQNTLFEESEMVLPHVHR
jgi:predicted transcriptional regulator